MGLVSVVLQNICINKEDIVPWNNKTNRNNMQENPFLYARLSLQVVYWKS